MRRAVKITGLILLTLGLPAFAHAQVIEQQSCPSGTTPITAPGTTTINNANGQVLRQWCVDNNGNMYSVGHYGKITISTLNGEAILDNNTYTNVQAAVNACPSAGCIIHVPAGTWPPAATNTALTINQSFVHIICSGIGSSIIQYTGTSVIPAVIDIGTSTVNTPNYVGISINGCTVSGNANVTNAIRIRSIHGSNFSHNSLINVTGAAFSSSNAVTVELDDLHTNSGEQAFTTQPSSCLSLSGPNASFKTAAVVIKDLKCQGVSGTGVIVDFAFKIEFLGGYSESNNKGMTISSNAFNTVVWTTDFEANTVSDVEDNGNKTRLTEINSNNVIVQGSAVAPVLDGGAYNNITINAGAVDTTLMYLGYNQNATGAITDGGTRTSKYRVRNVVNNAYDADTIPGASGVDVDAFGTLNNCSSSASPAVCGSAAAGSVTIAAGATTKVVNTTAVTANSQIFVMEDDSLGTKLGVTCNTSILASPPEVTARVAATSFTITTSAAPVTNPACYSYFIVN